MKIQQMIYFRTICESENMREAASKLDVSQSTLSAAIQKLENEFGTELFFRKNRRMVLSPAGEYFLEEVKILLEQYEILSGNVLNMVKD